MDRNRHAGASISRSRVLGGKAVRLPIEEYSAVSRNDFLTISDVGWIVSTFASCKDWAQVFSQLRSKRSKRRMSELDTTDSMLLAEPDAVCAEPRMQTGQLH